MNFTLPMDHNISSIHVTSTMVDTHTDSNNTEINFCGFSGY